MHVRICVGQDSLRRTIGKSTPLAAILLIALGQPATAQRAAVPADSARAQIRAVLRAFYLNLENQNWEALAAYVLSPKLLERRGAPGDAELVTRDRARGRASSPAAVVPMRCPSSTSPTVDQAAMRLGADWP